MTEPSKRALRQYERRIDQLTKAVRRRRDSTGPEAEALRAVLRAHRAEWIESRS